MHVQADAPPAAGCAEVPLIDLAAVHAPVMAGLRDAFDRVLRSGVFLGGVEVEQFEHDLATYVGAAHAVAVGSGTAALQLLLQASGIGAGDEVVLPPNTFFATAEAVVACGATPVLADVDEGTGLIDPDAVAAAVGPRTAAIVAVHLHGQPADMIALNAVARRHGLLLLEDAAQAIGAEQGGRQVGTLAAGAAFSFYPGKNLGALGDAGGVTTADEQLAEQVRRLRSHGESRRHRHEAFGHTHRMDAMQAAFLRVKLAAQPQAQAARDTAVAQYGLALAGSPSVQRLRCRPDVRHVHHHLVVRLPHHDRDTVLAALQARGIGAAVHYPVPLHHQPGWPDSGCRSFPRAEALTASILSLPLYAGITSAQVDRCSRTLLALLDTLPAAGPTRERPEGAG